MREKIREDPNPILPYFSNTDFPIIVSMYDINALYAGIDFNIFNFCINFLDLLIIFFDNDCCSNFKGIWITCMQEIK
jgi:hypothetical protein